MVADLSKGKSPFYPGQPVPVDLFVGRAAQIDRILRRGVIQTARGKPCAIFIQGEYGIGKSSIARFVQFVAEREHGLHAIYATLGGAQTLTDVAQTVTEATLRSGALDANRAELVRNFLAKYIGSQQLFGFFTLNLEALRRDAPALTAPFGMLRFLDETRARLANTGVKGILLALDEINGIAGEPEFAFFIKGLVEANAMAATPMPLLLMLCGVEERRREMIRSHQPVDRVFDVVDIPLMTEEEMADFFTRAFDSVGVAVEPAAMHTLTYYSAGFPKIMHLVGDEAFWKDADGKIDAADALTAVVAAAEEVGKKFVDQQVYKALRSPDYRSTLDKIAKLSPVEMTFQKSAVEKDLTESERKKFNNFLQKMKRLKVLQPGDSVGEYVFAMRMVRLYVWLQSVVKARP